MSREMNLRGPLLELSISHWLIALGERVRTGHRDKEGTG
jgi:hypothetical protein